MDISKNRERFWANIHPKFYKENSRGAPERRDFISDMVTNNAETSALELGCNSGVNLLHSARKKPQLKLVGLDACQAALDHGKQVEKNPADMQVGSIYDLSRFADNSFDVVFTCTVLIHIPTEKVPMVIQEMIRISRKFVFNVEDNHSEEGVYWHREGVPQRWKTNYERIYKELGYDVSAIPMDTLINAPSLGGANHLVFLPLTEEAFRYTPRVK